MSISPTSPSRGQSASSAGASIWHQRRDARARLENSIASGDLDTAKAAFQQLKELGGGRFRQFRGEGGSTATLRNDFSAIGSALDAGDADGAKAAMAAMKQHFDAARAVHEGRPGSEVNADVMPQPGMSISMTFTYVSVSFSYASSAASTTGSQLDVAG